MDAGDKITDAIRTNISFLKVKRLIHKINLMNKAPKPRDAKYAKPYLHLNNFYKPCDYKCAITYAKRLKKQSKKQSGKSKGKH
jgi:hypothetical protein